MNITMALAAEAANPLGLLNAALVPRPLRKPGAPTLPASVAVASRVLPFAPLAAGTSRRRIWFPLSATTSPPAK